MVSVAVVLAFLTARRRLARRRALLMAIGLGLGTGFWSTASQTLWQTETAVFGLALAVWAFVAPDERIGAPRSIAIGIGLGLAAAARPQLVPAITLLLAGTWMRSARRHAAVATVIVAAILAALCAANVRWFSHPLGALPLLQEVNSRLHGTGESFRIGVEGLAGLLVSPNRGLFIFSPVALVAAAGLRESFAGGARSPQRWCLLALVAQVSFYASYSVWWGGHTYGPRYLLDVLPLAVPLAAVWMTSARPGRLARVAATVALAWSTAVSATGAFCYPNDRWNVDPADVDRNHSRLWDFSDNQIRRCWTRGLSPQNFSLIDRAAVRVVSR
jgi:hypothetical protein